MGTKITALERGGWSAYGSASYDPRNRAVLIDALEDEEHQITVTMPSAISTVTKEENGAAATTPSISSTTFTSELSDLEDRAFVDFIISLSSGEVRRLRVMGRSEDATTESDYGRWR